ncbi:MAG: hypothetical protein GY804_04340 [Alphaproteobacteria bacterium]|nr:hypothetical protein [Alphaproteobacteria bacterium]
MAQSIKDGKGRKYALLPQELYKSLKTSNQNAAETETPMFSKVKLLDDQIRDILENNQMPVAKKARLYSQTAAEYLDFRQRAKETRQTHIQPIVSDSAHPIVNNRIESNSNSQPEILEQEGEYYDTPENIFEQSMFDGTPASTSTPVNIAPPMAIASPITPASQRKEYPATQQSKVDAIMNAIRNNQDISFDPNSRNLVVFGNKVVGTNIDHILNYVTKNNPSIKPENMPKGVNTFLQSMGKAGLSPELISNKQLRSQITSGVKGFGLLINKVNGRVIKWSRLR